MIGGELYDSEDEELINMRVNVRKALLIFNVAAYREKKLMLKVILGGIGNDGLRKKFF